MLWFVFLSLFVQMPYDIIFLIQQWDAAKAVELSPNLNLRDCHMVHHFLIKATKFSIFDFHFVPRCYIIFCHLISNLVYFQNFFYFVVLFLKSNSCEMLTIEIVSQLLSRQWSFHDTTIDLFDTPIYTQKTWVTKFMLTSLLLILIVNMIFNFSIICQLIDRSSTSISLKLSLKCKSLLVSIERLVVCFKDKFTFVNK